MQLCTTDFTVDGININPLRLLIVHQNNMPDFTALHFLEPPSSLRDTENSDTPKQVENLFNERLALVFNILYSMFGW